MAECRLEKKRKKYEVDVDTLSPELRAVVHEYGWLPPGATDARKIAQAMRIAETPGELRSQEDADKAYKVLKWYFRKISDIPEIIALLEPLKPKFKRRM